MPFQYTDIEDEIVERLLANLPQGYKAVPLPEKENQYNRATDKCNITVAYSDSQFDPPSSMNVIRQTEVVTVLLNIRSANLRGNFSINEALQLIKIILLGFKPLNLSNLWLQKIEFDERDPANNFFSYNVTFSAKKLQVQAIEGEVFGPLLKQVTLRDYILQAANDFTGNDFTGSDFEIN